MYKILPKKRILK